MHSSKYTLIFVLVLTAIVALILSSMATILKPTHDRNEKIYNKKAVLASLDSELEMQASELSDEDVQGIFDSKVRQIVIDQYGQEIPDLLAEEIDMAKERKKPIAQRKWPVYVFSDGGEEYYILSVRGNGLWDEIWGNIALQSDLNTVAGAAFDHQQETPGLGAEIKDNPTFPAQFAGKKLYTSAGDYVSVTVRKGGAKDPLHEVDAISGATVTCDGVTAMLRDGLKHYEPFLNKIKAEASSDN